MCADLPADAEQGTGSTSSLTKTLSELLAAMPQQSNWPDRFCYCGSARQVELMRGLYGDTIDYHVQGRI